MRLNLTITEHVQTALGLFNSGEQEEIKALFDALCENEKLRTSGRHVGWTGRIAESEKTFQIASENFGVDYVVREEEVVIWDLFRPAIGVHPEHLDDDDVVNLIFITTAGNHVRGPSVSRKEAGNCVRWWFTGRECLRKNIIEKEAFDQAMLEWNLITYSGVDANGNSAWAVAMAEVVGIYVQETGRERLEEELQKRALKEMKRKEKDDDWRGDDEE